MKNNRVCFISINLCKLTTTLLIICAIILGTLFTFKCNDKTSSATIKNIYTVVIDAGHGGLDVK